MTAAAIAVLASARSPAGGWGWTAGQAGNTECTALALLALQAHEAHTADSAEAMAHGQAWLHSRQHPDGSWPMADQVPDSSWMSSLAVLALAGLDGTDGRALRGAEWLLGREGRGLTFLMRAWLRLFPREAAVDHDQNLVGWPWTPDTAAWVEPTAWSLLAVKRFLPLLPQRRATERIRQGELMLADRMCVGGGWNYGNRRVLGVALPPYPDTTALALLALHDVPSDSVTGASLDRLRDMLPTHRSTLVLALAALCLHLYGEDVSELRAELRDRVRPPASATDVRSLALALLALDDRGSHFAAGPP